MAIKSQIIVFEQAYTSIIMLTSNVNSLTKLHINT